ncbi:hypothetical protein B9G69_000420 [Bdellovibrio sp. SKB1291214]|uniref:hypothetical protein n=1 Tax=Bdellovibrio sp. SKB1291214 TaxID=1732569 RepID=UPI00223EA5B2|nr:hypothetical protein [Bdellovibrio sp. SKB1291214]UYL09038.1 hypothetical protein B9G69_000420 [Bdellovibrio sp. SKB1291214]
MNRLDKVRKNLKANDDLEMTMSDDFFDRLHDKIMMEVEHKVIEPTPMLMRPRNLLRAHWRGWLYPAGGIMSVILMTVFLAPQLAKVNQGMQRAGLLSDGRERIVTEAILSPEYLSQTLISSQTDSDFFVDVARESSENFKVAKLQKIMGGRTTR